MATKGRTYRTLDGMRGLAALFVVVLHMQYTGGAPFAVHNAFIAVDLFFVLSGSSLLALMISVSRATH